MEVTQSGHPRGIAQRKLLLNLNSGWSKVGPWGTRVCEQSLAGGFGDKLGKHSGLLDPHFLCFLFEMQAGRLQGEDLWEATARHDAP